jgi:hypothetical protein
MQSLFTVQFWKDAAERAAKSFAQAVIIALGADHVFNVLHANLLELVGIGAGGAALSLLTSLASLKLGSTGTASLTKAVVPAPEGGDTT